MSNMTILYQNYFNTTTLCTVTSGTTSAYYLFDRRAKTQYQTSGDNSDLTTSTIEINFIASMSIDRIILQNINLKSFFVYYDTTTSKISLTSAVGGTSTAHWTGNSLTNMYLQFSTIQSSKIGIVATSTMVANQEKKVGQFWITQRYLEFENNPSAENYKTKKDRKEFIHEMAGGGWSQYVLDDYFTADIKLNYESSSMTSSFRDLYDTKTPFVFVPFPTSTNWDNRIYQTIWTGDYEFDQNKTNDMTQDYYTGSIRLRESSK